MESKPKEKPKKLFSSKVSIVGLFAALTLVLAIPLLLLVSQDTQDPRSRASEVTPTPTQTPSGQAGFVSGYVYLDTNKNGQRETEEKPYPNAVITISHVNNNNDEGSVTEIKTDSLGYFKFTFPKGTTQDYIVNLALPEGYKTINTNPVIITNAQTAPQDVLQFGLFPLKAVQVPPSPTVTPRTIVPSGMPQICLQVLTPARNSQTGRCNTFSNSCLPVGWVKDTSCQEAQTIQQKPTVSPKTKN